MADVKIAVNTVAMLRAAWPEELAQFKDTDIWVAFIDTLTSDEPLSDVLSLNELMVFLNAGFENAE
jgi:hypothetical protein